MFDSFKKIQVFFLLCGKGLWVFKHLFPLKICSNNMSFVDIFWWQCKDIFVYYDNICKFSRFQCACTVFHEVSICPGICSIFKPVSDLSALLVYTGLCMLNLREEGAWLLQYVCHQAGCMSDNLAPTGQSDPNATVMLLSRRELQYS